jgi:hypothetical protein
VIGNDVVDLLDRETQPGTQHRLFEARVFTNRERECWRGRPPSEAHWVRWAHWAAKESAYKALRRDDPMCIFAPRRFVVELDVGDGGGTGWVRVEGRQLRLFVTGDREHVHAWTTLGVAPSARPVCTARRIPWGANPRQAVRDLLRESVPPAAACVSLERVGRIPQLRVGGGEWPVSLSHHGQFVAVALLPEPVPFDPPAERIA